MTGNLGKYGKAKKHRNFLVVYSNLIKDLCLLEDTRGNRLKEGEGYVDFENILI